jgi:mannonate dehydratase
MQLTFRWFGRDDAIPLAYIRQIPGVTGVVSALYDVPIGDVWPRSSIADLASRIDDAGLSLAVIESIPVHEDIKLGRPTRDRLVDQYTESIRHMGDVGIGVLCYNFMPIFDWTRTDLAMQQPDGSTALAYDDAALSRIDLSRGHGRSSWMGHGVRRRVAEGRCWPRIRT